MTRTASLEASQAERRQLDRIARRASLIHLRALYDNPECGHQLHKFVETLNHFGADDAARMVEYVERQCRNWLRGADYEIRCAALSAINDRIQTIRMRAGLPAFDDPVGDEPDDVFLLCRKALGL